MSLLLLNETWANSLRPPRKIRPSEWTEEKRVLTVKESAEPGRWKNDRTPYLVGIMDAVLEPGVEEITLVKPTQVGGSAVRDNLIGYFIDVDPGPTMVVMPSESAAEEMMKERIKPMLKSSLSDHISPSREDNTLGCINLDSMALYTGWAGSPQSLASRPCRNVVFDEVDKYPPFSGRESDPISLGTERTTTFKHRKRIFKLSTPTVRTGLIWKAWEASGDKRRFHVPCPHCGEYQILTFGQVKWPKDEGVEKTKLADHVEQGRLAWYECASGQCRIEDHHKPKMLQRGVWLSETQTIDKDGTITGDRPKTKRIGFHLNALVSPWRTFSEIAAQFIRAEGDISLTMNFKNSAMAEPFEIQVAANRPSLIQEKAKIAGPPNVVPPWAVTIFATADVQQDLLYYTIRAWGYGFRSQLLRYGRVLNFDELFHECIETPCLAGNGHAFVEFLAVDGKYRKNEVDEFCKRLPSRIIKTLGSAQPMAPMYLPKPQGGIQVVTLNTNRTKDRLDEMLRDADETRWLPHNEILDDYSNQLASENKIFDPRSAIFRWEKKYEGVQNHLLDCEANQCGIASWRQLDLPVPEQPPPQPQTPQPRYANQSWMPDPESWMNR